MRPLEKLAQDGPGVVSRVPELECLRWAREQCNAMEKHGIYDEMPSPSRARG